MSRENRLPLASKLRVAESFIRERPALRELVFEKQALRYIAVRTLFTSCFNTARGRKCSTAKKDLIAALFACSNI